MSRSLPLVLLRAEGLVLVVASVTAFWSLEGGWGWFALLLLAPDLCFVAYLAGARAGTVVYNLAHTTVGPLLLGVVGIAAAERYAALAALIWLAHIGLDRALGLGLKYPTGFKDTHFRRL